MIKKAVGIKKVLPNAISIGDDIKIYEIFPHGEWGTYKENAKNIEYYD